jgi:Flp pilus assembly protein TadD
MPFLAAERSFDQGLMALAEGRNSDAVDSFRRAIEIERQRGVGLAPARYLSYFGLSLARSGRADQEAVDACREAVEREPSKPVYLLNLGRVYLLAGRGVHAFECFRRGIVLAPSYRPLLDELASMERTFHVSRFGLRRRPVIDRALGRARASWPMRSWNRRRSA